MRDVVLQSLIVLGSVAGLFGLMQGVQALGERRGWTPEVRRKAIHIATGLFAIALPALVWERWPVIALVAFGLVVLLALRLPGMSTSLGAAVHGVQRKSYGEIFLSLAVGFVFLRSEGQPILYALPLAVIALSDSAAALAGSAYGRKVFQVDDGTKSVEGVTVFFVVTWLVSMTMLLLMTDVPRVNVVVLSMSIAAFAAIVEMDSWNGLDNLFVPVAVHLILQGLMGVDPWTLAFVSVLFFACVAGFALAAGRIAMTPHAARAYCVGVFMLIGVSGAEAALLPVATVLAHVYARLRRPCRSKRPDLDLLASLAALSFSWLLMGEAIGPSAFHFYAMCYVGAIVAYAAILSDRNVAVIAPVAIGAILAHWQVVAYGPPEKAWHPDLLAFSTASALLPALAVMRFPEWFDRYRAPRVVAVSTLLPLATYLFMVTR